MAKTKMKNLDIKQLALFFVTHRFPVDDGEHTFVKLTCVSQSPAPSCKRVCNTTPSGGV